MGGCIAASAHVVRLSLEFGLGLVPSEGEARQYLRTFGLNRVQHLWIEAQGGQNGRRDLPRLNRKRDRTGFEIRI